MKTAIFRFFSFCFALLLLAACSRDGQPFLPDDTGKDDGDIPVDIVVSRSTFTGAGDGDLDTKFNPGCHIGVSVEGSTAYQNVLYKYPASGSTLVAVDKKIYCGAQSTSAVNVYYPYRSDGNYSTAFVEADQSTGDNYYKSDALVADGTISNGALSLRFAHRMAKVLFTFNEDVTDVTILNQSLNTGTATGSSSIKAYGENARKWKACIVPGQTQLKMNCKKGGVKYGITCNVGGSMVEGKQYAFNINKWKDKDGNIHWDLSVGSLIIEDNDTYYVTQSSSGTTDNNITISGSPTVQIENLNIKSGTALNIRSGTPTITLVATNTLKSTYYRSAGLQLESADANVIIKGYGSLKATGGNFFNNLCGAGIGGVSGGTAGTIRIEGGTIEARSENGGAGIGSGAYIYGNSVCGDIYIANATIKATGGAGGAGIGAGYAVHGNKTQCGKITIVNSDVTADDSSPNVGRSASIGCGTTYNNGTTECGAISITLRSGESKDDFLKRNVRIGNNEKNTGTVGTVTWKNSSGAVLP